jgi:4-amino-4-deoxy-L-arabinose transferase-like glycosyltransferase
LARSWPLLFLLIIAAVWLYRTPYHASNLEVTPDTVEYALAPLQLLETGRYEIMLEGRGLPPRYPPWFSSLVILPAYALFGHEPGNSILPITLLAVAGVGFAYAIGKRLSSTAGGALAGLAVLVLPSYTTWATQVMSDVPCTALMLGAWLLYLRLRDKPLSLGIYFGAGVLVAITTLFRPVFAAMVLPFLFMILVERKNLFFRTALLLAPMAVAAAASFAYNAAAFGSPLRNGYNFWVAVPYDYPRMTFSLSYVAMNFRILWLSLFPVVLLGCIAAWLLVRSRKPAAYAVSRQSLWDSAIFLVLTTAPMMLFHLVYFFPAERFFIPMLAGTAMLAASMLALLVGPRAESALNILLPALFLLAVAGRIAVPEPLPLRRLAAERVRTHSPDNAVVISAIDPVYLGRLAGAGSSRRIVPLSRNVEYASKVLVRKKIEDPRLESLNWNDPGAVALIRPHAEEAVKFVASERMDELAQELARGTPVFLESLYTDEREARALAELHARFKVVQRAPYFFELLPR